MLRQADVRGLQDARGKLQLPLKAKFPYYDYGTDLQCGSSHKEINNKRKRRTSTGLLSDKILQGNFHARDWWIHVSLIY